VRYERERPGELVHLDTKMLGRIGPGGGHRIPGLKVNRHHGIGWNRIHLAIDDHSRLAYAEELADEHPGTTAAFLERAWRFYASHGKAERLVRTLLAEWAYAEPFTEPEARVVGLSRFLDFYNRRRPHWSLAGQPPISRTPVRPTIERS
jgi:hypothetical protein